MSLQDYELIKVIGKGGFGTVHHVKRISDGLEFAMKMVGQMVIRETFFDTVNV